MMQPSWSWPPHAQPPDLSLIMGRLLERSEATVNRLDRIDRRLESGDARMDQISERIAALETRKADPMPNWERVVKSAVPYLIFLTALLGTGSIDAAIKVLGALGGGK